MATEVVQELVEQHKSALQKAAKERKAPPFMHEESPPAEYRDHCRGNKECHDRELARNGPEEQARLLTRKE